MKSAKLGAIFLISVVALAGIGVGYAAWTDILTIDGTIDTGSVGWYFFDDSGTYVWKIWDPLYTGPWSPEYGTEIYVTDDPNWNPTQFGAVDGFERVAYAEAVIDPNDDHSATVTYDNLFPCIPFKADLWIEYTGSVPGKINGIIWNDNEPWPYDADEDAIDDCTVLTIEINDVPIDPALLPGYQLHEDDVIYVEMTIHLEQDPDLMDLHGDFDVSVEVVQWNLYPYPPP
jgi:predicted ribosomally synthesized peptide with SipW-like signal peptide